MREVLLEDLESFFPAPDLGIGVPEHFRPFFRSRQIVIDIVSTNDGGLRKNVVDSIFQTRSLRLGFLQDLVNGSSNRSHGFMVFCRIALW